MLGHVPLHDRNGTLRHVHHVHQLGLGLVVRPSVLSFSRTAFNATNSTFVAAVPSTKEPMSTPKFSTHPASFSTAAFVGAMPVLTAVILFTMFSIFHVHFPAESDPLTITIPVLVLPHSHCQCNTGVRFYCVLLHSDPAFSSRNRLLAEVCISAFVTLDVDLPRFPFIFSSVDALEAILLLVLNIHLLLFD